MSQSVSQSVSQLVMQKFLILYLHWFCFSQFLHEAKQLVSLLALLAIFPANIMCQIQARKKQSNNAKKNRLHNIIFVPENV